MKRYLEYFFRHPLLLSLPVVIAVVAGVGLTVTAPRTFTSVANLWCDATVPNPSTLQKPAGAGQDTPSTDTLPVLQEFLQTQSFDLAVAGRTAYAGYLSTHSKFLDDQLADRLAGEVSVLILGPQVLSITAKTNSATLAASLATGVVAEYIAQRTQALQQRDRSLVDYYTTQFDTASAALANAEAQLGTYLSRNPQIPNQTQTDPRATQLSAQVAAQQLQQATVQSQRTQAQLDLTHVDDPSALHIIDAPVTPIRPDGRVKQLLLGAIGGLLAGVVITMLTLILLVVLDQSVRDEDDIESVLSLQLVGAVEQMPKEGLDGRPKAGSAGHESRARRHHGRRRLREPA